MSSILVVDDEASIRFVLRVALEDAGHEVVEAADGRAALTAVAARRPDLVSTDFMMPGMNGRELIERLRADPDTTSIPILMISASKNANLVEGVDLFIGKPFDPVDVLENIALLLAKDGHP